MIDNAEARFINEWTKKVDYLESVLNAARYNIEQKQGYIDRMIDHCLKLEMENERLKKDMEFWQINASAQ